MNRSELLFTNSGDEIPAPRTRTRRCPGSLFAYLSLFINKQRYISKAHGFSFIFFFLKKKTAVRPPLTGGRSSDS